MNRLTVMTPNGAVLEMNDTYPDETAAREDLMEKFYAAVDRLAAHEDTNLMPEGVKSLRKCPLKLDRNQWDGYPDYKRQWGVLDDRTSRFEIRRKKFCGSCGRPLTEAAWAELERRINGGTTD